jgi:hypothetical protein
MSLPGPGLSSHSTDWERHVTSDPRRASSPLRSGLGFRYRQVTSWDGLRLMLSRALEINSAHHELVGGIGKGDAKLVEWLRSQLINITIIAAPMHNTPESINA